MDTAHHQPDWRTVLREQGRSIAWLADRTGRTRRTVYAYSQRTRKATPAWLAEVARVLGVEEVAP